MVERHHALAPFLVVESKGTLNRGRSALLIKRVDQKSLAHLSGGTCKFAQHQYPVTFELAGDIFFCHKIHTIAQGSDPTDIS